MPNKQDNKGKGETTLNNIATTIYSIPDNNRGLELPQINKEVPLNQSGIVMAHNVNMSTAYNAFLPNQNRSITELLDGGVRGFQLTLTDAEGGTNEPALIHLFNQDANPLLKWLSTSNLTFSGALKEIKAWQDSHPKEAVILNFQVFNPVNPKLLGEDTQKAVYSIFDKKTIYNNNNGDFDTLNNIEEQGNKLIIFSQNKPYDYFINSQFGNEGVNNFGTYGINYIRPNNYESSHLERNQHDMRIGGEDGTFISAVGNIIQNIYGFLCCNDSEASDTINNSDRYDIINEMINNNRNPEDIINEFNKLNKNNDNLFGNDIAGTFSPKDIEALSKKMYTFIEVDFLKNSNDAGYVGIARLHDTLSALLPFFAVAGVPSGLITGALHGAIEKCINNPKISDNKKNKLLCLSSALCCMPALLSGPFFKAWHIFGKESMKSINNGKGFTNNSKEIAYKVAKSAATSGCILTAAQIISLLGLPCFTTLACAPTMAGAASAVTDRAFNKTKHTNLLTNMLKQIEQHNSACVDTSCCIPLAFLKCIKSCIPQNKEREEDGMEEINMVSCYQNPQRIRVNKPDVKKFLSYTFDQTGHIIKGMLPSIKRTKLQEDCRVCKGWVNKNVVTKQPRSSQRKINNTIKTKEKIHNPNSDNKGDNQFVNTWL